MAEAVTAHHGRIKFKLYSLESDFSFIMSGVSPWSIFAVPSPISSMGDVHQKKQVKLTRWQV